MKTSAKILAALSISISFLFVNCSGEKHISADLVLLNGNIATMEDSIPYAQALAVIGDKIVDIGANSDIEKYIGDSTEVIELNGEFVMPAFIESHAHFLGVGKLKIELDLREAGNWDEVVSMVAKTVASTRPGQWIIGRGWHQEKFNPKPSPNVNGYPVHNELSKGSPNNPVILKHASGHAIFANAKAMQLAGIDASTPDPAGGTIVRDEKGNPIGVFEENAEALISKPYEEYLAGRTAEEQREEIVNEIKFASQDCISKGIATFHDAGETFKNIDVMKQLADSNKLDVRLYVMVGDSLNLMEKYLPQYRIIGEGNNHLTVRAIKQYVDGALGSRGAWMLEPYTDLPDHTGSNVTPIPELEKIAELAAADGYQLCIHAIGDRGNREVLDLYERTFRKHPDKTDLRWRIEHAQHLSAQDIPRFAKLGVIAAMQTIHCTSDAVFVPTRIGDARAKEGAYVWRKLIDAGAAICDGTDGPVEDIDPIKNFYAAVTRRLNDGSHFYPDQKMTRMEALKSYTINGAYAAFEENLKGSLKKGKLADITILSKDLLNVPAEEIPGTKVLYTIVGGKILFCDTPKK